MFWDGTRWIDERAPAAPPPARGRTRNWLATGVMVVGIAALAVPFVAANAVTNSADRLVSSWSGSFETRVFQESSVLATYAGAWEELPDDRFLGSTAAVSVDPDAIADFTFTGSGVSWIGPEGPQYGKAAVYLDGLYVRTVDSSSRVLRPRETLFTASFPDVAQRTLTIRPLSTVGRPAVAVDAYVVRGSRLDTKAAATLAPPADPTPPPAPVVAPPAATLVPTATPTSIPSTQPAPTSSPTPVPTAAPTPAPTPAPAPTPSGGISGVYGPGIGMDSLNNTQVGGPRIQSTSYRFRASTSSKLDSIRVYIIDPTHPGYGAGTGGTWEITVQTDDGSANHAPSGTVLATTSFKPVDDFPVISWPSPASLTAGRLYHVVFRNVDPNPTANYASLDGVFMHQPTVPRQAAFSDVDWGQPTRSGSGAWSDQSNTVPIMQLNYANGVTAGLGYMENWSRSAKTISGGARVRQRFTVSGSSRLVTTVSVRLKRLGGSSPLRIRLETSSGVLVEQATIPASSIPVASHPSWATYRFARSRTLLTGRAYNLVLTSASDTSYLIFVIRQGSSYGFSPTTYFADGSAQYNPGTGWVGFDPGWRGPLDQGDLQLYFR
jgi:hypothetical protein